MFVYPLCDFYQKILLIIGKLPIEVQTIGLIYLSIEYIYF